MAPLFLSKLVGLHTQQSPRPAVTLEQYISSVSRGPLHYLYLTYWKYQSPSQRIHMLLLSTLTLISVYVISPTISYYLKSKEERAKMFTSKRKDKFTTGFINTRNDCFANSSIQAFASMPGLNLYLNDIMEEHHQLLKIEVEDSDEIPKVPLHHALATIVDQLQEQITSTKAISVWPFLKVIETIFNSKISTSQNDAHELVSLILETLENETIKLKKFIKKHAIKNVKIPSLPFNGLLADQLTCLSCGNSSTPSFHSFSVFSLPVPQVNSAKLTEMLKKTESETITGYNCLRCKINAIVKIEGIKLEKNVVIDDVEIEALKQLKELNDRNVSINHDLPELLEEFIKNYVFEGYVMKNLTSTIVKKTSIVKAPQLLTVHLSRSMFTGQYFTRNGCRVKFQEELNVEINDELVEAYEEKIKNDRKRKKRTITTINDINEEEDDEDDDDDDEDENLENHGTEEDLARIHSKVLTKHDENVSTTDLNEHDNHNEVLQTSNSTTFETPGDSDEDNNNEESVEEESCEILTKENVVYKLRAVIRHQGTHNAGHYECFRHKPLFVKDPQTDKVIDLSPSILFPQNSSPVSTTQEGSNNSSSQELPMRSNQPSTDRLQELTPPSTAPYEPHDTNYDSEDSILSFSKFRNRIGSFVGRKSSFASTNSANSVHTSLGINSPVTPHTTANSSGHHGLSCVSENIVTDLTSDLGNCDVGPSSSRGNNGGTSAKRYRKIATVNKYPYWRISDTQVSEVKAEDLLAEEGGVYMIYYEKV